MKKKFYFFTNRNVESNNYKAFGIYPANLRVGTINVDLSNLTYDHEDDIELFKDNEKLGSFKIFDNLYKDMLKKKNDTIVFIHGYNTTFKDGVIASAKLYNRLAEAAEYVDNDKKYNPNMLLFSWPSDGKILKYYSDRIDAEASGEALARSLNKICRFFQELKKEKKELCNQKINLIAHSMGNYVLRHGLNSYKKDNKLIRFFDEIILIAADEDVDALENENKLKDLKYVTKRVTVYYNDNDRILNMSEEIKNKSPRLGDIGPLNNWNIPSNMEIVDVTKASPLYKEHYSYNDKKFVIVQRDMYQVLKGLEYPDIKKREYLQNKNLYRIIKE